jgi:hypothetical protein
MMTFGTPSVGIFKATTPNGRGRDKKNDRRRYCHGCHLYEIRLLKRLNETVITCIFHCNTTCMVPVVLTSALVK